MRRSLQWGILMTLWASAFPAHAQFDGINEGVRSFQQERDAWRRQNDTKINVLSGIVDSLGKSAVANVVDAEQAFCYRVENRPADYDGYTLNGMAVTGFCGVINADLRQTIAQQFFATAENINFNTSEQCVIRPKLMLRFARGVDFTDVLVSAPCYSIAVFYGGKVKTYNFKPGGAILDAMVEAFNNQTQTFVSPTLLNQLLPIGVPQTVEQQQTVRKQQQPVRNWEQQKRPATAPAVQNDKKAAPAGWNRVRVNVGK